MNTYLKERIDIVVKKTFNRDYNINQVVRLLGLDPSDEYSNNCKIIYNFLLKHKNISKELDYFLNNIDIYSPDFCKILTNSIYELFYPYNFKKKSPINISEKKYKDLIRQKKTGTLSKSDSQLLNESLHIKLCHCIKKLYIKNLINKEFFNTPIKYNPYAICTSSVYNKRGLKSPYRAVRDCKKKYNWYI
jgi:hypothetical protein